VGSLDLPGTGGRRQCGERRCRDGELGGWRRGAEGKGCAKRRAARRASVPPCDTETYLGQWAASNWARSGPKLVQPRPTTPQVLNSALGLVLTVKQRHARASVAASPSPLPPFTSNSGRIQWVGMRCTARGT
jgi:hypothetical protein